MDNYILPLPTLSDIFSQEKLNNDFSTIKMQLGRENASFSITQRNQDLYLKAQKEGYSAIATINQLLEKSVKISDSQNL